MFIPNLIPNRLTVRLHFATAIIILLFLASSLGSGFLAWTAQNDAKAINIAGSIRMATYRLSFLMGSDFDNQTIELRNNIEQTEVSLSASDKNQRIDALIKDMDYRHDLLEQYQKQLSNRNTRIDRQIERINEQWHYKLIPLLKKQDAKGFYSASLPYIKQVDAVVSQLQYRNERRQDYQQLLQLSLLILMILIMYAVIHEIRKKALFPIQNLIVAKEKFVSGELNTRVVIEGYYEFEELGTSFNDMVSTIEKNQKLLESEVKSKTAHLTQANQVLTLLYDFAKYLTTSQVSISELNRLIADFGEIIPELEFTLCLKNDLIDNKDAIAIHSSALRDLCSTLTCDNCLIKTNSYTESFDVRHQRNLYGELRVRPKTLGIDRPMPASIEPIGANSSSPTEASRRIPLFQQEQTSLTDEDHQLTKALVADNKDAIIALTNLISTAMFLLQQRQQEHQIILLEERATIARELHDSLAQSLSYLKIQVSILERKLQLTHCNNPDLQQISDSICNIKEGLTSAYQHLRDLLVTFRLSLNDDSFDEALHNSAREFAEKGGLKISVNNQVMSLNLNASEQVNIIQIVREALSNICRHANARNVAINFSYIADSDDTLLTISDDGKGLSNDFDQTHHHGLMIMKERASSLGGTLEILQNEPKGTLVKARFTPSFFIN